MVKFRLARTYENSAYESQFVVEWKRDVRVLVVQISDNHTCDVLTCLDEAEAKALRAYLEGEL